MNGKKVFTPQSVKMNWTIFQQLFLNVVFVEGRFDFFLIPLNNKKKKDGKKEDFKGLLDWVGWP